jgi:F-box interacting protein
VNVYDKRYNCWRNIQSFPGFNIHTQNHGIYLNGTINWLAISDLDHYWDFPLYIVSLDLGNETYTQLSLPSCFDQVHRVTRTKPNLGILKDRLCFSYDDVTKTHFVLWQMNEYGVENSWTQLLKLSYQALQIDCTTQEYCIFPPLGTLKNDHLILIESVDDRLRPTILSKQEGNTEIPMNMLWLYTRDYVPSLISPSQNSFFF